MDFRYLDLLLSLIQNIDIPKEQGELTSVLKENKRILDSYNNTTLDKFISEHIKSNNRLNNIKDRQMRGFIVKTLLISLYDKAIQVAKTKVLTMNEQEIFNKISRVLSNNSDNYRRYRVFSNSLLDVLNITEIESMVI